MNLPNILLTLTAVSYLYPLNIIYSNFENNYSISEIVTKDNLKYDISLGFCIMGIFVILYESLRLDKNTIYIILPLIFSIIGVINTIEYKNTIFCWHTFFAVICFGSIAIFNLFLILNKNSNILKLLFLNQIFIIFLLLLNLKRQIFYYECLLLLNFSLIYLYNHYLDFIL